MPDNVPEQEKPILERLLQIRNELSTLKRDRSSYLKIEEIMPLRLRTEEEMKNLSQLRGGSLVDATRQLNRTDHVLDEACQMISLCFLCLGKSRESPAVYSQMVAIQHCFDRLNEVGIFAEETLFPYKNKLKEIENILNVDDRDDALPKEVMELLKYKLSQCKIIIEKLFERNHEIAPELKTVFDRLLNVRRSLVTIGCRHSFSVSDIRPWQEELEKVDQERVEGRFVGENGKSPAGQAILVGLLDQIKRSADDLAIAAENGFCPELQKLRERLVDIKSQLERLELTHKWTLRQTDLFKYQHELYNIVQMRSAARDGDPLKFGKFLDDQGQAPSGQVVLNFLLHKCYNMIAILLNESVPVSETLVPIYNQLTTVRQCLLAVKGTGAPCTAEELSPYQMKLSSIDALRKDGKFYDDRGHIPEGQALCVTTLEECYSILDDLREDEGGNAPSGISSEPEKKET